MSDQDLKLKISSEYDAKGSDAANKAVNTLGDSTGKTTQKLRGAAGAASALAGVLGQGAGALGSVARTASGALASLSAGWIGVAVAIGTTAVAAYLHFKNKATEALKSVEASTKAFHAALIKVNAQRMDRILAEYAAVEKAAITATAAVNAHADAVAALDAARAQRDIAELNADEQQALNKTDSSDPLAVEKVKLDFATRRAQMQAKADTDAAIAAEAAAQRKLKADEEAAARAADLLKKEQSIYMAQPTSENKKRLDAAAALSGSADNTLASSRISAQTATVNIATAFARTRAANAASSGAAASLSDKISSRDAAAAEAAGQAQAEFSSISSQRAGLLMDRYTAEAGVETAARNVNRRTGSGSSELARAEASAASAISAIDARLAQLSAQWDALNAKIANSRTSD